MSLERRTPLGPGRKALQRGSSFAAKPKPLTRTSPLKPASSGRRSTLNPGTGFAVSDAQRQAVRGRKCAVTECFVEHCDPAHLIGRSLLADVSGDPRAVVPLCRLHHDEYDGARTLDLLPHLEPSFRVELAFAVERVGLIAALEVVTNLRWRPVMYS